MADAKTPVVLISGPVGVGKSTVGEAVSDCLAHQQIPHTFIDFDQLRNTYPKPADDRWGDRLGLRNLADVWRNSAEAGARNLIIAYVVEYPSFVQQVRATVPQSTVITVQLTATVETLQQRVRQREIGAGLDWHLNRAAELARLLKHPETPCDLRIQTDGRSVSDIAAEIVGGVAWRKV